MFIVQCALLTSQKKDMRLKAEQDIKSDSKPEELTLVEQVFTRLQIHSEGFKPSFFTNKDLVNLCLTSKTLHSVASYELNQREAQKLLTHVVLGEQNEAQALIEKRPELLLISSKATDYAERTIVGTAFQAALGAGDKPMWKMMLPYFENLEEALRQFHEQFPDGIEDDTSASQLLPYYNAIASAIINHEDQGLSVIEEFRKKIVCQKEITRGKHFNLQHLIAAYRAYIDNFNIWDSRGELFWQKVIGFVQRQMTAYDAQIHCSPKRVLENENSFTRSFELFDGKKFFPVLPDSGLGFDFACYSHSSDEPLRMYSRVMLERTARLGLDSGIELGWMVLSCHFVEKLVEQKTSALAELRELLEKRMYYQPKERRPEKEQESNNELSPLIKEILQKIEEHKSKLKSSWYNPFLSSPEAKIQALDLLKKYLQNPAKYAQGAETVGEIIRFWETSEHFENKRAPKKDKTFEKVPVSVVIGQHRNFFFNEKREGITTSTEDFINSLETEYDERPIGKDALAIFKK